MGTAKAAATAMMGYDDPPELTQLGRFMKERYISSRWLAGQVGVSPATVSRWCWGKSSMSGYARRRVLRALQERARDQEPPRGLLDDQLEPLYRAEPEVP